MFVIVLAMFVFEFSFVLCLVQHALWCRDREMALCHKALLISSYQPVVWADVAERISSLCTPTYS